MAVDYFHRLLVVGPVARIRQFRRDMHRQYPRTLGGTTWTESVPFSFEALYELAPAARSIEAEIPYDPYELSNWPIRRIGRTRAEVRYQFQTRNLELAPLIRVLSRARPHFTFTLVTHCFDDSSIESFRFVAGRQRRWQLPDSSCEWQWERARRKFGLRDDDVYDDDEAKEWAEEQMRREALTHWDHRAHRLGRYNWWNRPQLRDLDTERELALVAVEEQLAAEGSAGRRGRKLPARRMKRGR